ncbi:MAG: DJ-1/PfpI family protein [bacterium]
MTGLFAKNGNPSEKAASPTGQILNAGFVCVDKVYNSELMAPYDVLQHSYYRDSTNYIRCFIVTPDGKPFTTFEGIRMVPDFSFKDVPPIDILVIPSTGTSMTADLQNAELMRWLKRAISRASYVITVCDGAFPLAATGAVDGRTVTTFPADRKRLSEMFPRVSVRFDANFVADGRFITSVGGARSYEPALFLVEKLYSKEHALRTAKGLVLDWDLHKIPHVIVGTDGKTF